MDATACENTLTTIIPGFALSIGALLLEQFLGSSKAIKANSIAELMLQISKAILQHSNTPPNLVGNPPFPVPPPDGTITKI
jgi:hypothetical protein